MAHEHPSGLAGAYDRSAANPDWTSLILREDRFAQAAEINEIQSITERRGQRIGNLIARDGDRIEGADVVVDVIAGTVILAPGRIYARGDVRNIAAATLTAVPMTGDIAIGVRIVTTIITETDAPVLLGLHPGSEGEGEPGAARAVESVAWGFAGDGEDGDLFSVYLLRNGVVIDQTPPPSLSGINQAIAVYDRDANGNYIVEGCRVTALGKVGDDQVFSIEEGVANIWGFKRTRGTAMRHAQFETFDLELVASEPHTFDGSGTIILPLNHSPIASISTVIVTKEVTETVTRGTPNNTSDVLSNTGVTQILEVKQGGTTYVATTSFVRSGDRVDWAPAGAEPIGGSSYTVKYRYLAAITPSQVFPDGIEIAGGVTGEAVFVSYAWKLPRIDLLCLDQTGGSVYVAGKSNRSHPVAPQAPGDVLPLAEIHNTWIDKPDVVNNGIRAYPFWKVDRMYNMLIDTFDLLSLERLRRDIDSREPVAKHGVFVDPFTSDRYRDAGEAQTAAVFLGSCQLAIDPTFYTTPLNAPATLAWTEEIIVRQERVTACMLINPYANFEPLPGAMSLNPTVDFWTESAQEWASPATRQFGSGNSSRTTVATQLVDERTELLEFLRPISLAYAIKGFGPGEILQSLTFDGLNVTPGGTPTANANGELSGTFVIPANVPAGSKSVKATGMAGTTAEAVFVGQGTIEIDVMRRVTTITRWQVQTQTVQGTSGVDPLAQTFTLDEGRHIAGIDLRFCALGNTAHGVLVDLVHVENGIPTTEIITSAFVDTATVVIGAWKQVRFTMPVYLPADREFAFVVKTDDNAHSLSIARIGDLDTVAQQWVAAQPYTIGVLLSSSNAKTWTPHQAEDLAFRLVAAKFDPITRTIDLGAHALVDCSDLMVRATAELPTAAASIRFEIERAGGEIIRLDAGQVMELTSYVTETVALRAILSGNAKVSPILYPGVALIAGKIRATGTYVSVAMPMGTTIRLATTLKTKLPAGSSLVVAIDAADDNWQTLTASSSSPLNDGWIERTYLRNPHTAVEGRVRLSLAGTPAARPSLADLRAVATAA
jgi:hypothetical protein